jgi:hypothetical protein
MKREEFEIKDKFYILNWDFLFQFKEFFNHFFSCSYPFNEAELILHQKKIILGSPGILYSFGYSKANYGLIFNKCNIWNQTTFAIYHKEPQIVYAGNGTDEYSFEIKLNKLPYIIEYEIEMKIIMDSNELISDYQYLNDEEIRVESNYVNLGKELKDINDYYSGIKSQVNFDPEIVFKIINSNNQDYFCNQIFCNYLLNKILVDIDDFKIENFYDNI